MRSRQMKITILIVSAIVVVMTISTALGVITIRNLGNTTSDQLLYLM